jgi:hypothetical protein
MHLAWETRTSIQPLAILLFIWQIAGIDFLEHMLIIGEGVCLVFVNFLIPGQWSQNETRGPRSMLLF